jgi:hypothetical protein
MSAPLVAASIIATRDRVLKPNGDVAEGHFVSLLARSLLELRYDPLANASGYC